MATVTFEQIQKAEEQMIAQFRKFKAENPHCFEPFQMIVVKDDGTEVDLCDIHRPLNELIAEALE